MLFKPLNCTGQYFEKRKLNKILNDRLFFHGIISIINSDTMYVPVFSQYSHWNRVAYMCMHLYVRKRFSGLRQTRRTPASTVLIASKRFPTAKKYHQLYTAMTVPPVGLKVINIQLGMNTGFTFKFKFLLCRLKNNSFLRGRS